MMSSLELVTNLVEKLGAGDEGVRNNARQEIRGMGREAIKHLNVLQFRQEGDAYTEVFRVFAEIGDDLFEKEGAAGIDKIIIDAMEAGAKKTRQYAAEEVHLLSVDALTRWGLEVPPVLEQKVLVCHVCGRTSKDLRVKICALHSCDLAVCKEDTHIIETRFGQFDGSGGAWFCTEDHHEHANKNMIDWN